MELSTAVDILFLLAAVYLFPRPTPPAVAYHDTPLPSPAPNSPAFHSAGKGHSGLYGIGTGNAPTPRIILHPSAGLGTSADDDASAPSLAPCKPPGHGRGSSSHKRKAVSFSITSLSEVDANSIGSTLTPAAHRRPPTPYMRAPPTPSELLALGAAAEVASMPSTPLPSSAEAAKMSFGAEQLVSSKDVMDQMGLRKQWVM